MLTLRKATTFAVLVVAGGVTMASATTRDQLEQIDCRQPVFGAVLVLKSGMPALLNAPILRVSGVDLQSVLADSYTDDVDSRIAHLTAASWVFRSPANPLSGVTKAAISTYTGINAAVRLFAYRTCALRDPDTTGSLGQGVASVMRSGEAIAASISVASQTYGAVVTAAVRSAIQVRASATPSSLFTRESSTPTQWTLLTLPDPIATASQGTGTRRSDTGPDRGGTVPTPIPAAGAGLSALFLLLAGMARIRRLTQRDGNHNV